MVLKNNDACKKYCWLLQEEHSALLLTFNKLPFVVTCKSVVLSMFEWPFNTGFDVSDIQVLKIA